MGKREEDFLKRLRATFKVEAEEHLRVMSSGILELEKASSAERRMDLIEAVFREAHSLKGAARAVNAVEVETVCQSLEKVFSAFKHRGGTPSPHVSDTLSSALDGLAKLVQPGGSERASADQLGLTQMARRLESALEGLLPSIGQEQSRAEVGMPEEIPAEPTGPTEPAADVQAITEPKPLLPETVRVSTAKLNSLLLKAEELLSAKLAAGHRAVELRDIEAEALDWEKEWAKVQQEARVLERRLEKREDGPRPVNPAQGQAKVDASIEHVTEFFSKNDRVVKSLHSRLAVLAQTAEQDYRALSGMTDALLEETKKALMLPFASLLEGFPKLVRDLSRDRGKDVELVIRGAEIEADRRVLEQMKDPLIHLVRNSLDHGLEDAEERKRRSKPPRGTVTIALSPKNGDKIEVLVSDDGRGIDSAKVSVAALKRGLISSERAKGMAEPDILPLVFESGVSTSPMITEISGHGLGLAIVRERVEGMGGKVSLETQAGRGTTFRIVVPVILATLRGAVVRVGEHFFVVPMANMERAMRVAREEIQTVENRETIRMNGQAVSLVHLAQVLELPSKKESGGAGGKNPVLVLRTAESRIAFLVEEILNEQEVLMKGLGKQLSRVRNVAGATLLGSGKVVPVLNVPDLMKSAVKVSADAGGTPQPAVAGEEKKKSILVVEDSITARTLLKSILEAAGHQVKTAVDGMDAFTALRAEEFDLVVSDVDMPRLNGFDLTAKIRADKKLAELPVVLVTALESREDRERGILVGANAYMIKKSFDQSNLLEVIRRLI